MRKALNKAAVGLLLATVAAVWVLEAMAGRYDEPSWESVGSAESYELRRYAPYLVAETEVEGGFRGAGNRAFRILAGYIFGGNEPGTEMAMTVPVLSTVEAEDESWTYQFVMEPGYTLDTLPAPRDGRVRLREMPERLVAVHGFSGTWSEGKLRRLVQDLVADLREDGLEPVSEPMLARYNGPFTPWFMRRNEILVEVARRG
jgi:hypothetical protein